VTPRKTSPSHQYANTPSWNTLQPQPRQEKPLPDAIIQTLTQRVQNRVGMLDSKSSSCPKRRYVSCEGSVGTIDNVAFVPRLAPWHRRNLCPSVCREEVTVCFTSVSVANCLPFVCLLRGTKWWRTNILLITHAGNFSTAKLSHSILQIFLT
jgi:hypothetical protein